MSVQWLLQSNHPDLTAIGDIGAVLRDQGDDVHLVALKSRSAEIPDLQTLDAARPVVCYGPSFVPRAFGRPELSPGIFFDPATFRWSAFREGWRDVMISSDGIVVSVADVLSMSGERSMFVRPDEDSKAFNGGLFDKAALQSVMLPALEEGRISVDTQVVIARPRTIDAEWRIFIVDRQVVAASSYRWNGVANIDLHVPHRVIALAFEAIELWTPADVFCLDIALASERYGIVEANCFNAARFYGADTGAIVGAVSSFARSTFRVRRQGGE